MNLHIVILAAGQGTRMYSDYPKVLHWIGGTPILERILQTVQQLNPVNIHVVYGNGGNLIPKTLAAYPVHWHRQEQQLGTAHALAQALPGIPDESALLVLVGDIPLISVEILRKLTQTTPDNQFGLLTVSLDNPTGMGRILRDAHHLVTGIIEEKDATPEQKAIHEVNTGIILGPVQQFKAIIPTLNNQNAKGEYYLTDVINVIAQSGQIVHTSTVNEPEQVMGVNDRYQLSYLERYYQRKTAQSLMLKGVTICDPARFDMRGYWEIGQDVEIDIDVVLEGNGVIGTGCKIGAFTVLKNVTVGKDVEIRPHCVIENTVIADGCIVGPFARIRPGTKLGKKAHVGNFVEVKNSNIGEESKVNHLSYIGDTNMGSYVNIGAGTITCNYDGVDKYQTTIKDHAFIGSGTQLIAPVTIGEEAVIGAGSTITKNAPSQTLTLSRAKQVSITGWQRKKQKGKV